MENLSINTIPMMRTMVASLLSIAMMISSVKALCSNDETLALLAFKAGVVTDPTGTLANWSIASSDQSTDCCTWNGIVCNATTGSITAINLSNSSLSGTVGFNSTTSLSIISSLDLSYNNFSGSIPDDLSSFTSLESLLLQNNSFGGIIPVTLISLATSLTTMDLSSNQLSGEIPQAAPFTNFPASSYADNAGLCGTPLPTCQGY